MLDLSLIDSNGVPFTTLVSLLKGVNGQDFIMECPHPFLLQIPVAKPSRPKKKPDTDKLTSTNIEDIAPASTAIVKPGDILGLKRSKVGGDVLIHLVCSRSGGRKISLGRGEDCDVVLNDDSVSKRHAEMHQSLGRWFVTDLGSQNGTYVNGKKIEPNAATSISAKQNVSFSLYKTIFLLPELVYGLARRMGK